MTVSLRDEFRLYRAYDERGALLYIGQTGRAAAVRWMEHMAEQPWAHEVAQWVRDPHLWPTVDAVLRAERQAIMAEQPRYNYEHNLANPHRVPVYRQRRGGRPLPAGRPRPAAARGQAWVGPAVTAALWLACVAGLSIWFGANAQLGARDALAFGVGGGTLATLFLVIQARRVRRWWRRTVR